MRKIFVSVSAIILLALTSQSNAQSLQYGGKIGLNFANVNGKDASNYYPGNGTRTGLLIGGFVDYAFAPMLSVQPEVLYSMKGTSGSTTNINGVPVSYTMAVNYIEIPVLLKFKLPLAPGTPVNANIYAGPDFAFNVASSLTVSSGGQSQTTDESNNTNGFDFNLAFGGGVGFKVGPTTLGIELRYSLATGTADKTGGDIRNSVFGLIASVGI
ncbi:MAG: porin family protein [Candidatus Kryptoniota bacterium]